jgi:hypothetical protein
MQMGKGGRIKNVRFTTRCYLLFKKPAFLQVNSCLTLHARLIIIIEKKCI